MYNVLKELSDLSLALQHSDVSLPITHRLTARQIEVFSSGKGVENNCSTHYNKAYKAFNKKKFHNEGIS